MVFGVFDVPKWHLLLHREHREVPLAKEGDEPHLRLEDELFERFHAGELDALSPDGVNPALAAWAQRFRASCEALPVFGRLAAECRDDAAVAATAVETIETNGARLKEAMRAAAGANEICLKSERSASIWNQSRHR